MESPLLVGVSHALERCNSVSHANFRILLVLISFSVNVVMLAVVQLV